MDIVKGPFNVRVYGLLIHNNEILVTDEFWSGRKIRKFPGGGLEFGEGLLDGLKREFREEFNIEIEIKKHFYTTDFFQRSAFDYNQQVISVYYVIDTFSAQALKEMKEMVLLHAEGEQVFRFIKLEQLDPHDFTFPIDQKVAGMILENNYKEQE